MNADVAGSFRGRRVLVTGGLGFIGSTLARRLAEQGAHVTIVDNLAREGGGNLFNLNGFEQRVQVHVSDLLSTDVLMHFVGTTEYIFNLAGLTGHLGSMNDPLRDLDSNLASPVRLLQACRQENPAARIVYTGTRQVYGRPQYLPVDEKHPLHPTDANGIHKLAAEFYHLLYGEAYGLPVTVLRLTNTYGPRMRIRDAQQNFLGIWVRSVVEGRPFEVWGGEQVRDYMFVDDAVEAILRSACAEEATGRVFNLGGGSIISLKGLADALMRVSGGVSVVKDLPENRKHIDIGDSYCDSSLLSHLLGWTPQTGLEEGLSKTVAYYKENLKDYV